VVAGEGETLELNFGQNDLEVGGGLRVCSGVGFRDYEAQGITISGGKSSQIAMYIGITRCLADVPGQNKTVMVRKSIIYQDLRRSGSFFPASTTDLELTTGSGASRFSPTASSNRRSSPQSRGSPWNNSVPSADLAVNAHTRLKRRTML